MPSRAQRSASSTRRGGEGGAAVDLERYVPAYLTWIANKLARGASQQYLGIFGVGIEIWRCLVTLAIESSVSAQQVSNQIGMDKASVSRCFQTMQARGMIVLDLSQADGRMRIATLTNKGRRLHDKMLGLAMERERAFLAVLSPSEKETLIGLLRRLHDGLPGVDAATQRYVSEQLPAASTRLQSGPQEAGDE